MFLKDCPRIRLMLTELVILFFAIALTQLVYSLEPTITNSLRTKVNNKLGKKNDPLPPCQACKNLVSSFRKGMEETSRGKFDGGDADWEESRLGNYANSEVRLVEIQEKLCSSVEQAQEQCHTLAEQQETNIEEWWFKKKKEIPDLHIYLCINTMKVCCQANHYGPDCKPCLGGAENPCSGQGKCKGNGTRKGSGTCLCNIGYTGEICSECSKGFFLNQTEEGSEMLCSKCDKSCKGHCREGGNKGCEVCADGYHFINEMGCVDIDECIESERSPCSGNTFCANNEGSFMCLECDKVCNGCNGDGPDMCEKCAEGFTLKDGVCVENRQWKKGLQANFGRYITYLGLFVATYIIYNRNAKLAFVVGATVTAYIGVAEYLLGNWEEQMTISSLKSMLPL